MSGRRSCQQLQAPAADLVSDSEKDADLQEVFKTKPFGPFQELLSLPQAGLRAREGTCGTQITNSSTPTVLSSLGSLLPSLVFPSRLEYSAILQDRSWELQPSALRNNSNTE